MCRSQALKRKGTCGVKCASCAKDLDLKSLKVAAGRPVCPDCFARATDNENRQRKGADEPFQSANTDVFRSLPLDTPGADSDPGAVQASSHVEFVNGVDDDGELKEDVDEASKTDVDPKFTLFDIIGLIVVSMVFVILIFGMLSLRR